MYRIAAQFNSSGLYLQAQNDKPSRCWDSATCEPLDAAEVQQLNIFIQSGSASVCCMPAGSQDTYLSLCADILFLLH